MDQATPSSSSSGDPVHAAADQACSSGSGNTSASGCETSSSSVAAAFSPVAARIWKSRQPWQLPGPAANTMFQRPGQLVLQKHQPLLPQSQQVAPHPFAVAAAQYGATSKVLSPPLLQPQQVDDKADDASTGQQDLQARGQSSAPLPIPMQQPAPRATSSTRGFSRQLSSPARLRAAHLLQVCIAINIKVQSLLLVYQGFCPYVSTTLLALFPVAGTLIYHSMPSLWPAQPCAIDSRADVPIQLFAMLSCYVFRICPLHQLIHPAVRHR